MQLFASTCVLVHSAALSTWMTPLVATNDQRSLGAFQEMKHQSGGTGWPSGYILVGLLEFWD